MSNKQNKQKNSLVIILLLVLIAGISISYSFSVFKEKKNHTNTDTVTSNSPNPSNLAANVTLYTNKTLPNFSFDYDNTIWKVTEDNSNAQFPVVKVTKNQSVLTITFGPGEGYGGAGIQCTTDSNFAKVNDQWARIYDTNSKTYSYAQLKNLILPADKKFDDFYTTYSSFINTQDSNVDKPIAKQDVAVCFETLEDVTFTQTTFTQDTVDPANKNLSGFFVKTVSTNPEDLSQLDAIVKSIKF